MSPSKVTLRHRIQAGRPNLGAVLIAPELTAPELTAPAKHSADSQGLMRSLLMSVLFFSFTVGFACMLHVCVSLAIRKIM
jgi:hypothetical protein